MKDLISPASIVMSTLMGLISGYIAYRQKKSPYIWFFVGFCLGFLGLCFLMLLKPKKVIRKEKTIPVLQGPSDKLWFYLDPTHQQVGPISYGAIAKAFTQGIISQNTYIWHEDLTEWKTLKEFLPTTLSTPLVLSKRTDPI